MLSAFPSPPDFHESAPGHVHDSVGSPSIRLVHFARVVEIALAIVGCAAACFKPGDDVADLWLPVGR